MQLRGCALGPSGEQSCREVRGRGCVCRACSHVHTRLLRRTPRLPWPRGLSAGALDGAARISLSRAPRTSAPRFALHYIRSVIAAEFLPPLRHRLPPRRPRQLSAARNLLLTLHPSAPVSEHCARPQFAPIFFLKLPLFTRYCLLTHFIILNLASISLSLPHPRKVQGSSFQLF